MFETKLRIQRKLANIKLRRKRDSVTLQVHDSSLLTIFTKYFIKLILLVFFAMVVLIPFAYMILISSMSNNQADLVKTGQAGIWPQTWELGKNLATAATGQTKSFWPWEQGWQQGYLFSFILTFANVLISIVLKIFITMLLGYAFSLKKWWGKEFVWFLLMTILVLPEVALLSGQRWVVVQMDNALKPQDSDKFNLFNYNLFVIAIPFVASIFNGLMFRNAFESIPNRIKEVAMVDGAVGAKYLFKIAIPMVAPTTLTVIILTTLASWNSFLWPSLIAGTDYRVMSVWLFGVGVDHTTADERTYYNIKMAGAIWVILPMFIFFFVARNKIMNAISRQGSTIKG
ncbi:carbohydrate ABC transporter permease [Mycoplasma sp. ES3157-GEN-MYC]|uniref:Carbohydrate ABC transporter permease n=1 Tax=Mycoplasma miroungigenitalium TaxID=754515 RepID=A0A6M4JCJ4_9MOLU|nr:carbohydrate ABC transporter permease [Mycoplasma miroungigenitalium]MBU4690633.1 carbohydrate ABC transporter permease [Mycoplasma miroungigenitalium]MBU4691900.1 carbohydrate ABC transporter permease [Mycoplasma miroungigenitalium]QJR43756.1 carbohydrate ABC transporter permease [Mycoplasma miroungigenitalium]